MHYRNALELFRATLLRNRRGRESYCSPQFRRFQRFRSLAGRIDEVETRPTWVAVSADSYVLFLKRISHVSGSRIRMLWRNLDKVTDSANSAISATCLILVWTHYFRKRAWQNLAESYVVKLNSNRRRGTLASRCSFLIPWGELVFISFPVANISLFSFCSLARIQHSEHMWHFYSAAIWIFFDPEDSFYFWPKRKVYLNFCHFSLLILCWLSTIFVSKCPQRCVFLTKCIGWWWPCSLPFLLLGEISLKS